MIIQRLSTGDNAIVALVTLGAGQQVRLDTETWTVRERIPAKHKFAATDLSRGDRIRMYGATVGIANKSVRAGELLTCENVNHSTDDLPAEFDRRPWRPPDVTKWVGSTFEGYRRRDGRFGTGNYWLVVPMVFCENRNIEVIGEAFSKGLGYESTSQYVSFVERLADGWKSAGVPVIGKGREGSGELRPPASEAALCSRRVFPHVDGVKILRHGMGCGGTRQDARSLCGLLAGYISHPNVAGATVLSLGCENAQMQWLREELDARQPAGVKPVLYFEQQKSASERRFIEDILLATFDELRMANELRREPCPLSGLVLGLKCGGSDGFSGLSANPALGHCSDLLVAMGGSSVLCEFPELCGAERSLCERCEKPELSARFLSLMKRYDEWAHAIGSGFEANPSPGNIRDGLITDSMKSLGAARKSGTAPIIDVVDYPGLATGKGGVTLLCTPGNDVEATTALAGAGCNVAVFTTGLGTPTGNPICPIVKVSTNTELAERMRDIIDFDSGGIVRGERSVEEIGEALLEHLIEVASGKRVPAAVRLGQDDFLPWKRGVSL